MIANAAMKFNEHGTLKDAETSENMTKLLQALVDRKRRLKNLPIDPQLYFGKAV